MGMPRLPITCGYLIKNEEMFLTRSIESLIAWVDELIIFDSGSDDESLQIAKSFEKKLPKFQLETISWRDDFSWARNQIIEKATNDHIFFVDGDEVLDSNAVDQIKRLLQKDSSCASFVQRNYVTESTLEGSKKAAPHPLESQYVGLYYFDNWMERFLKISSGIRYAGNIHESLIPQAEAKGFSCKKTPLLLHHYGRLKPIDHHAKAQYYLTLSKSKWKNEQTNPVAWIELIINHLELKNFKEAFELAQKGLSPFSHIPAFLKVASQAYLRVDAYAEAEQILIRLMNQADYKTFCLEQLSTSVLYQGRLDEALLFCEMTLKEDSENFVAHVNSAVVYFENKDFKNAARHIHQALLQKPNDTFLREAQKKLPSEFH